MDKIKRLILLAVPMSVCNFRCNYCYLTHRGECYQGKQPKYKYSPVHVAKAFSQRRLGGPAFFNICADGETLLAKDIDKYVYELLKEGHYIEFVSNLTITPVLKRMLAWDKGLLKHLSFKCSFHFLQLKEKKLLQIFADNVHKVWEAGASANIEMTPCDEMIPYIDEIKKFSMCHFGALPHLSIARNDGTAGIEYLTQLPIDEYDRIWGQFDSNFWKFKKAIFKEKRTEFCYAGDWALQVDLASGFAGECYRHRFSQNIFKNIERPIRFRAVGLCPEPHCYNGHALLTLGCIPNFTNVKYGDIRNRVKEDGSEWLQSELKSFFNSTLVESNREYSEKEKQIIKIKNSVFDVMKLSVKKVTRRK
ncbi:radical SAM protein [Phocaeicola sp.]